jgi:hypothetical protein
MSLVVKRRCWALVEGGDWHQGLGLLARVFGDQFG